MLKLKKIFFITAITSMSIFSTFLTSSQEANAFQPAAHTALIKTIAKNLPNNSIIKTSIESYPDIAAWGATAPDLGYFQPSELGGYAPWADRYHYYKVGTFAKEQLREALKSNDYKKIAFAAGWVSHVLGDLACHGIYVNPEAGVFLDNEDGRSLHKDLENKAEPYVWNALAGLSLDSYNNKKLYNSFSNIDDIPFSLMNNSSEEVYDTSPSISDEKNWSKVLMLGLKTGMGYSYTDYNDSISFLSENNRKERLTNAFSTATNQSCNILELAEQGDYSKFSDRWNLDVGSSKSPISSLTTIVTTGTKYGAGTDDDIYFGIQLKTGDTKEWLLDKAFYNDFENGDKDEYYLYINDVDFSPKLVSKVWIRKDHINNSLGEAWYLDSLIVNVNGKDVLSKNPAKWIKSSSTVYFDTDWSSVTNVSDPVF